MQEAHLVCITADPAVITWESYLGFLCRNVCIIQTPVAKQFLLKQPVYAQYSVLLRSLECHENLLPASLPVLEFQGLSVTRGGGDGSGGWALSEIPVSLWNLQLLLPSPQPCLVTVTVDCWGSWNCNHHFCLVIMTWKLKYHYLG